MYRRISKDAAVNRSEREQENGQGRELELPLTGKGVALDLKLKVQKPVCRLLSFLIPASGPLSCLQLTMFFFFFFFLTFYCVLEYSLLTML